MDGPPYVRTSIVATLDGETGAVMSVSLPAELLQIRDLAGVPGGGAVAVANMRHDPRSLEVCGTTLRRDDDPSGRVETVVAVFD